MGVIPCGKCGLPMMTGYANLHDCIKELREELARESEEYNREAGFLHEELSKVEKDRDQWKAGWEEKNEQYKRTEETRQRLYGYWVEVEAEKKKLKGCTEDTMVALGISKGLNDAWKEKYDKLNIKCAALVSDGVEIGSQLTEKASQLAKARLEIDWIRSNWQNAILVNIKSAHVVEAARGLKLHLDHPAAAEIQKALNAYDKAIKEES